MTYPISHGIIFFDTREGERERERCICVLEALNKAHKIHYSSQALRRAKSTKSINSYHRSAQFEQTDIG